MTYKQIAQMTVLQVYAAFYTIRERQLEEMKFQAKCLGAEIKDDKTENFIDGDELSEDQEKALEKLSYQALKSKGMRQHGRPND